MDYVKQHYVWRHYLRQWADKESIWAFLKTNDKIIKSDLMGVAQERFFYKLIDLTNTEEDFLVEYIENNSPSAVKQLNFDFLRLFISTSKLKKALDTTTKSHVDKDFYATEVHKLEVNLMEKVHGKMEALGNDLIACRNLNDLKGIEQGEKLYEAILFLCFQYVRTNNMRKSALKFSQGKSYEELSRKTFNIISYVTATTLATNISFDNNLKFIFHENNTNENFITCDQPVFNILNDKIDEDGNVTDFELYYPVTPKHALTLHFRDDKTDRFLSKNPDEEIVNFLNRKVLENSDFFVFADTKEQLERMKENNWL